MEAPYGMPLPPDYHRMDVHHPAHLGVGYPQVPYGTGAANFRQQYSLQQVMVGGGPRAVVQGDGEASEGSESTLVREWLSRSI